MLTFDSVRLRLDREQPLTFLEFNYMILQAYDFLELSRRVGCRLQLGGSDQWGNIVNGIELGAADRRDRGLRRDHAVDHHRRRRKDGQDRRRRDVAQSGPAEPIRLLAVLAEHRGWRRRAFPAGCSPTCRWRTSGELESACRAPRSTRRRSCSRPRRPRCFTGAKPPKPPSAPPPRLSSAAAIGEDLPTLSLGEGMTSPTALTALGFTRVERGSEAQDRRRCGAAR